MNIPDPADLTDEALTAHCKRFVKTNYHPCGTAGWGRGTTRWPCSIHGSQVRGIEKLRVCDLSAMPDISAGNTNAPAMMLGSRCANFILDLGAVSSG